MVNYITFTQAGIKSFYFNSYDLTEKWEENPEKMVDGFPASFADTFIDAKVQLCNGNSCTETSIATITKVELRAYSFVGDFTVTVRAYLRPVFSAGDGDNHMWLPPSGTDGKMPEWSEWFDITNDTNAPATWTWSEITGLDVDHYPDFDVSGDPLSLFTSKIEIRATYISRCTIIAPEQVSTDHAQNIKAMNMWNGERIVFGESRSKWSLLLKGQDWESDACDKISCLKQLGLNKLPIVLSGLNNINWDTEWMIKSFGWKLVLEKPLRYEWIILLEKT